MIKQYDRQNAIEYAQKWALSSNPSFYHFGGIGGDCTNYISQCLLAGGAVMNFNKYYGWYYENSNNRSPSWTSVQYLERFLLSNSDIGPFAKIETISNLEVGDLIQLRQNPLVFNHTLIISKIENGEIFVCAHSNDALNKPLKSYYYRELKGLKIEGIRV